MEKLQVTDETRKELSLNGIVICTYGTVDGQEFDCIDMEYAAQYPDLQVVDVVEYQEEF
jgi:hypothetical protein